MLLCYVLQTYDAVVFIRFGICTNIIGEWPVFDGLGLDELGYTYFGFKYDTRDQLLNSLFPPLEFIKEPNPGRFLYTTKWHPQ